MLFKDSVPRQMPANGPEAKDNAKPRFEGRCRRQYELVKVDFPWKFLLYEGYRIPAI